MVANLQVETSNEIGLALESRAFCRQPSGSVSTVEEFYHATFGLFIKKKREFKDACAYYNRAT
jgi:hypothetical protein